MSDITPYKQAAVTIFSPADVQAAKYIKMLLPYGEKLTDANALALSAYSRIHGLDPYNGECWFLVREKKNDRGEVVGREELGVMPGIKGLRKKAREQMRGVDVQAHFWIEYEQSDAKTAGVDPTQTAVVYKAILRDSISAGQHILNTVRLSKAGYSKDEIRAMLGDMPTVTGFGAVKTQELRYLKQTPVTVAKKRAEAEVIRQRFDLGALGDTAEEVAPDALEQAETAQQTNRPPAAEIIQGDFRPADTLEELGFGQAFQPPARPEPTPQPKPAAILPPEMMTLAEAEAVTTGTDGKRYGDLTSDDLHHRLNAMLKAMPDAPAEKLAMYERKVAAARLILSARNQ